MLDRKIIKKYVVCFWLVSLFFTSVFMVSAQDLVIEFDPDEGMTNEEVNNVTNITETLVKQSEVVVDKKQAYIEGYRQLFELNENEIAGLEAVLIPIDEDIYSLDTQLQVTSLQLERMKTQEETLKRQIQGLEELDTKLKVREKLMALEMKGIVEKFLRVINMYFQVKRQFVMEDGRINLVQLITNSSSPADLVFKDMLLQKTQEQLLMQMSDVYGKQTQMNAIRNDLLIVEKQLLLNQERLKESKVVFEQQIRFKEELLAEKTNEQQFFKKALDDALSEQLIIANRIRDLASGVNPKEYQQFPWEEFVWPVAPVLGISAYFQDPSYRSRFGLDHNAVDIPTDQLTPVRATLSGRVIDVQNAGKGYSYLQLAHRDGYSTVYGHIYSFKIKEGDNVRQGEINALSGGAVGTNGAGRMTTGPHLHFEVLKNGKHVNPINLLPKIED